MVSIAAWISGCSLESKNTVGELVSNIMSIGEPDSSETADIKTLFRYTCVTNDSYQVKMGIKYNKKPMYSEMSSIQTTTNLGTSGPQNFFIHKGDKSKPDLNKDIYDWRMFDSPEAILLKLVNVIGGESYDPVKHKEIEFEFNLEM